MAFGWDDAAIVGFFVADFIYHRLTEPPPPKPARSISIPRVDAGAPFPLLYGRCRVNSPILAFARTPKAVSTTPPDPPGFYYYLDQLYVLGLPFFEGTNRIYNMWIGDTSMQVTGYPGLSTCQLGDLVGDGNIEDQVPSSRRVILTTTGNVGPIIAQQGGIEFLNGNDTQTLVDVGGATYTTRAGQSMLAGGIDITLINGYRGFLSVFLYPNTFQGATDPQWKIGQDPKLPTYSFECSSYVSSSRRLAGSVQVGAEANPADVLWDLLTNPKGKLGLDPSRLDFSSFSACAIVLAQENHGFSRSWEEVALASEMIAEVLRQIDAVMYEDPVDGLIKLTLVRGDYDPSVLPVIDPSNCEKLENFAASGWTDVPNKVRITYTNRQDSYHDGSGLAQSLANALGQDGQVRELQLQMPGVCTQELADTLAARELAARSRPMIKCSAIVSRDFFATVPGDVVRLSWPQYGISNVVMRVANANRGTLKDGRIRLDLLSDYYYTWRNQPPAGLVGVSLPKPAGSRG